MAKFRRATGGRFVLVFLATWAILRVAHLATVVPIAGYDRWLASIAGSLLRIVAVPSTVVGAGIHVPNFVLEVADPCNGVELVEILLALVIAFPARWRRRAFAVGVLTPAVVLVNLVRIASLVALATIAPERFEFVHQFVWQIVMILLVFGLGFVWMLADVRRDLAPAAD